MQTEVTLRNESKKLYYALKFMRLESDDDFDAAKREIQNILRIPQSPAIVQYYGWFQVGRWAVVGMELCSGDIINFLASSNYRNASEAKKANYRWEIIESIAVGLSECHSQGLI